MATAFFSLIPAMPTPAKADFSILGVLDTRPSTAQRSHVRPPQTKAIPTRLQNRVKEQARPYPKPPAVAQIASEKSPSKPLDRTAFSADSMQYEQALGIIVARGNVEIIHEDRILLADTVSFNQNKDMISASGNVRFIEADGTETLSQYMELTSDFKAGVAEKMILSLDDRSFIRAEKARREQGRYTIAENGRYSPCRTCDEDNSPLWSLRGSEIRHDSQREIIEYYDTFFEVKDIPVMYLPYFRTPAPTKKRDSGILTPAYGTRSGLKTYMSVPYYHVLSPYSDVTITPTYFSEINQLMGEVEYRQNFSSGEIELGGSLTYADGGAGARNINQEEFRGHIDSHAEFDINRTWRWGTNINVATDDTYTRRYGLPHETIDSYLVSDAYVEGFRGPNYMRANISGYQDQRNLQDDDLSDIKAEYIFAHQSEPLKTGAYWDIESGLYAINYKSDRKTSRISSDVSYIIPHISASGDMVTLTANLMSSGYYVSKFNHEDIDETDYSGFSGQMQPSLALEWRKPMTRAHIKGKATEIFEPMAQIVAAPNRGDDPKVPNEDSQDLEFSDINLFSTNRYSGLDRLSGGHRVDFGFNWGIFGQEGGFTNLFLGQSYRLREDSTFARDSGLEDKLSDLVGRLTMRPTDWFDILYRFRIDKNDTKLNRSETELSFGPNASRFSISHFYIKTGEDQDFPTREEISGNWTAKIAKNWTFKTDGRYRFNEPEGEVNYGASLAYNDEYGTLILDVDRNFSSDRDIPATDTVILRLELTNLGGFNLF